MKEGKFKSFLMWVAEHGYLLPLFCAASILFLILIGLKYVAVGLFLFICCMVVVGFLAPLFFGD